VQYVAIGVRCLIGVVFLVSFASKVARPGAFGTFRASVREMRVLPSNVTTLATVLVVAGEAVICLLLVLPVRIATVAGFLVASALLMAFSVGIVASFRHGVRTSCRCFGVSATPLGPTHVIRNSALTALCMVGAAAVFASSAPAHLGGVAVAIVAGLVLGGMVTVLDEVADLFRSTGGDAAVLRGRH
jgi:hypothetical protein